MLEISRQYHPDRLGDLLHRPLWKERWWRLGAPFALLFPLLGAPVLAEQIAYCRALLPLTLGFNLLLLREGWLRAGAWYLLGNIGMAWAAICMVV